MGLFDLKLSDSPQYCASSNLQRVVSECGAWQALCEKGDPSDAAEKIIYGPHPGPWGIENFTPEELQTRFCEAQIWAPDQQSELLDDTGNVLATPYRRGSLVLRVRRIVREAEWNAGEQRCYQYLLAAADLLAIQMMELANADQAPRINAINYTNPMLGDFAAQQAQGRYAHWYYVVNWGDPTEE